MSDDKQEVELKQIELDENNQIEEIKILSNEEKFKSIFMGTLCTIILLLISLSYGITWGVLFLIYTKKDEFSNEECQELKRWDRALYIVHFICAFLHLISSVIQLLASAYDKDSNIAQYITFFRSCINYIAGIVILIGINVAYVRLEDTSICGSLSKLNLAYIICEWAIIGFFICFVFVVCIVSLTLKKRKHTFDD